MTGPELYERYVLRYRVFNGGGQFLDWANLPGAQRMTFLELAAEFNAIWGSAIRTARATAAAAVCDRCETAARQYASSERLSDNLAIQVNGLREKLAKRDREIEELKRIIVQLKPPERIPRQVTQRQRTEHIFFLTPETVFARHSDPDEAVSVLCDSIESSEAVAELLRYELPEQISGAREDVWR